jgi:hypothetical protein
MTSPVSRFSVNKAPALATVQSIDESRCSVESAAAEDGGDMSPTTTSVFENRRPSLSIDGEAGAGGPPGSVATNSDEQPTDKTGNNIMPMNKCVRQNV